MTTETNRICKDKIAENLHTEFVGKKIYVFDEVTSTFDKATQVPLTNGTVICARAQTNGRGRLGRSWQSTDGGIYFSLLLKPDMPPERVQLLTAICALGVQKALSAYIPCKIKWPNDIISEGGLKLCGILTKMQTLNGAIDYINVGIGINANICDFAPELRYASSLRLLRNSEVDENDVLCRVLESIEVCLKSETDNMLKEFAENCMTLGSRVKVIYAGDDRTLTGECIKINKDGSLTIKKDDGSLTEINSGEVSVRGVYGESYV